MNEEAGSSLRVNVVSVIIFRGSNAAVVLMLMSMIGVLPWSQKIFSRRAVEHIGKIEETVPETRFNHTSRINAQWEYEDLQVIVT